MADQGLQSPVARDFYLQSHGGLKGSELFVFSCHGFDAHEIISQRVAPPTTRCFGMITLENCLACKCLVHFRVLLFLNVFPQP
jgi:hypothetical protein